MGEASLLEHPLEASEVDHGVLNWALHLGIWLPFGGKVGAVVVGMPTCYLWPPLQACSCHSTSAHAAQSAWQLSPLLSLY